MRVLLIILGIYFGNTCLFGQNNLKTVKRDSTSEQQRTLSSSDNFRSDINKLNTTIDSLKSDKADINVVNRVKEDLNKTLQKMYFIFAGAIIIAMIIASLFTYLTLNSKITRLKKRIYKLEEEKASLNKPVNNNDEVSTSNETSTPDSPLKITDEILMNIDNIGVENVSTPLISHSKTYFAGPDGAFFHSEFEHQENTPNKSLFEFMVNKDMPQEAKFSVLLTPYSLNTIINNSSVFEAVCEFSELNFEANYIDSQRPGKAKRTANGWQVIEKTKVRLGKT